MIAKPPARKAAAANFFVGARNLLFMVVPLCYFMFSEIESLVSDVLFKMFERVS
jgi:hypothetical protein